MHTAQTQADGALPSYMAFLWCIATEIIAMHNTGSKSSHRRPIPREAAVLAAGRSLAAAPLSLPGHCAGKRTCGVDAVAGLCLRFY